MTPTSKTAQDYTTGDWRINLPPVVLHFAPVGLGFSVLFLSLCGPSVFRNFDEERPGTWLSLLLMCACLLLTLPPVACESMSRAKRWMAAVLSGVTGLALYDETHMVHEATGKAVRRGVSWISPHVLYYTDDTLIILGTVSVWLALVWCLRKAKAGPEVRAFLWPVLLAGLGHGTLDLVFHGRGLLQLLRPHLAASLVYSGVEIGGFYEESQKLWTEWFVVLFLLRFFHGQRGPLRWTLSIWLGTMLAPLGLWQVSSAPWGIPLVVVGGVLRFVRNLHLFVLLSWFWVGWTVFVWWRLGRDEAKVKLAGLLYVCPFYLLLGTAVAPWTLYAALEAGLRSVQPLLPFLTPHVLALVVAPIAVVPGVLGGLVAAGVRTDVRRIGLCCLAALVAVCALSRPPLSFGALRPLAAGGALLVSAAWTMRKQDRPGAVFLLTLLVCSLFVEAPVWHAAVLAVGFAVWLTGDAPPAWERRGVWAGLVTLNLLAAAAFAFADPPVIMESRKPSTGPYYTTPLSVHYEPSRWGYRP